MPKVLLSLTCFFLIWYMMGCNQSNGDGSKKVVKDTSTSKLNSWDTSGLSFIMIGSDIANNLSQKIKNEGINTFEGILAAYAPKILEAEGNYKYNYLFTNLGENGALITLEETGIPDDSLEGKKVRIHLLEDDDRWKVASIKESYRCWPKRGHETWSAEICN